MENEGTQTTANVENPTPMNYMRAVLAGGLIYITSCVLLSQFAFSRKTRNIIKERAGNRSELSGRRGRLECCHISHRKDRRYDLPSNGRLLLTTEHYLDHYRRGTGTGLTSQQNDWALNAIWGRMSRREKREVLRAGGQPPNEL